MPVPTKRRHSSAPVPLLGQVRPVARPLGFLVHAGRGVPERGEGDPRETEAAEGRDHDADSPYGTEVELDGKEGPNCRAAG